MDKLPSNFRHYKVRSCRDPRPRQSRARLRCGRTRWGRSAPSRGRGGIRRPMGSKCFWFRRSICRRLERVRFSTESNKLTVSLSRVFSPNRVSGWVRRLVKDLFALPENVVDDWDLIDERTVLNRILEQNSQKNLTLFT